MYYLVTGSEGPGFASPEEAAEVLEEMVLPSFDVFMKLQDEGKILAGGLAVGERTFVFIMDAPSHEEADEIVRSIPLWGAMEWEVVPLQSFEGRAATEKKALRALKA